MHRRMSFRCLRGARLAVLFAVSAALAGSSLAAGAVAGAAAAASLLIVAPLAIFATARYLRAGKENEIRDAMAACLAAGGYRVSGWTLAED